MEAMFGKDDVTGSSSKKKAPSSSPPSVHQVLSNDDLLSDILLLLPPITLTLVKRVSKQWLSIITSPTFISKRNKILVSAFAPPSGVFIHSSYQGCHFLSFHSRNLSKWATIPDLSSKRLRIEQSCNGLLLCCCYHNDSFYVCNPLIISMFKMLPPLICRTSRAEGFRLAFDPRTSPHYKVVHMGGVPDLADVNGYSVRIQVYSSESGEWRTWDDRFPSNSFYGFHNGIYTNGAIHWLDYHCRPFHHKLELVEPPVLTRVQSPLNVEAEGHDDHKLFAAYCNLLLFSKDYFLSRKLNIYEMRNGCSEWSIKYVLDFDNLLTGSWKLPRNWGCKNVLSVYFGEREEDSFMVIESCGNVLHYKFVSETVTKILDVDIGVTGLVCHDFIASFAQV